VGGCSAGLRTRAAIGERVAVIRPVRHQPLRTLPRASPLSRHSNPVQSSFGQHALRSPANIGQTDFFSSALPERSCHRGTPAPSPASLPHPGWQGLPARSGPRPVLATSAPTSSTQSHTLRTLAACPSSDTPSARRTGCRREPYDHLPADGPFSLAPAREAEFVSPAHRSVHFPSCPCSNRFECGFETVSRERGYAVLPGLRLRGAKSCLSKCHENPLQRRRSPPPHGRSWR